MSNYHILSISAGDVARINRQGGFRQVTTQRSEHATGSIDTFQRGRQRGTLVLHRHAARRVTHLQLSVLHPSGRGERCNLGTSGEHSEWVDLPHNTGAVALFEGDSNRDGRRDYLILLSNGAAVLLERDARTSVCGFFGPPSDDLPGD